MHTFQPALAGPFDGAIDLDTSSIVLCPGEAISCLDDKHVAVGNVRVLGAAEDVDCLFEVDILKLLRHNTFCLSRSDRRVEGFDI